MISFCILTWNKPHLLRDCVSSIVKGMAEVNRNDYEVIVVDNGHGTDLVSTDRTLRQHLTIIKNSRNEMYARGTNQSVARSTGDVLVILNDDIQFPAGSIAAALPRVDTLSDEVLSFSLIYPSGSLQASIRNLPTPLRLVMSLSGLDRAFRSRESWLAPGFDYSKESTVEQPMFSALAMRRHVWNRVGELNTSLPLLFNDVEWFHRAKRHGVCVRYVPQPKIIHRHGASVNQKPVSKVFASTKSFYRYVTVMHSGKPWLTLGYVVPITVFFAAQILNTAVIFLLTHR